MLECAGTACPDKDILASECAEQAVEAWPKFPHGKCLVVARIALLNLPSHCATVEQLTIFRGVPGESKRFSATTSRWSAAAACFCCEGLGELWCLQNDNALN